MTTQQLIDEGRRLTRPAVFLRPQGTGQRAAVYYAYDEDEIESTGFRAWLSVDAAQIPGKPDSLSGYLTLYTNEDDSTQGKVEVISSWPDRTGTELFAHPASVLPPVDAVFARGSPAVAEWIALHGWERTERYNDNFGDKEIVRGYEQVWMREFPLYFESDVYAILGGWHWPCADSDWHDLIDDRLMVMTLRDSEPWVEAWLTRSGDFSVIPRIT